MKRLLEKYPLQITLGVAIGLRLMAVLFAKGYMASDDYFQTIRIVCQWLAGSPYDANGHLVWAYKGADTIARNPLYTLALYGIMKPLQSWGVQSLDAMMYVVRTLHALVSLVGVWAVYRITERATENRNWALGAGLLAAAHFTLPFLAVRNLIEMVGGDIWIVSLCFLYLRKRPDDTKWLLLSGMVAGIAWMIRFQLIFAIAVVPIALWIETKQLRASFRWLNGFLLMLLFSGWFESIYLGNWWNGTINHVLQGMTEGEVYHTSHWIYIGVLIAAFFPPISLIVGYLLFNKQFWKTHTALLASTIAFVLFHTFAPSRQERYMVPILFPLIVIGVLAVWYHVKQNGWWAQGKRFTYAVGYVCALNLLLLPLFTFNYGHKGEVEPLVRLQKREPESTILFFSPDTPRVFPLDYAAIGTPRRIMMYTWPEYDTLIVADSLANGPYYCLLYPPTDAMKAAYVDSIARLFESPVLIDSVGPSSLDYLLHLMNPKHNRTNAVWVYRSERLTETMQQRRPSYNASQSQVMNSP